MAFWYKRRFQSRSITSRFCSQSIRRKMPTDFTPSTWVVWWRTVRLRERALRRAFCNCSSATIFRSAGANAVVVGRSEIVGKPMALMLLHENATVTICHSRTRNLAEECRRADILVAAIGKAALITAEYIKPGA